MAILNGVVLNSGTSLSGDKVNVTSLTSSAALFEGAVDITSTISATSISATSAALSGILAIGGIANVSQSIASAAASGAETLDQVLSNGNVSTLAITASGYSGSTLALTGDATINGSSTVAGNSTFSSDLLVSGDLEIGGIADVSASLAQALLPSTETLQDVLTLGNVSTLAITASGYSGSTLALSGDATINGDLAIKGIANVSASIATAAASGTETLDQVLFNGNVSDFAITASGFSGSALALSGDATINGDLEIGGIADVSASLAQALLPSTETLQDVLENGSVTNLAITASGYSGSTLALTGDATINGTTTILGSSAVTGNGTFSNDLLVFGDLGIGGIMNVSASLALALRPSTETLQDVLENGNDSTLAITASGFSGSTLQISGNATVGSLVETSSERFKENVVTLPSQVSNISLLNPVSFDWIESGQHDFGFIAEQVEQVYPEFVEHNEEGLTTGVKYSKMVSVLVKAVQELQVEVAELKANK
jgi:hypothetical protein